MATGAADALSTAKLSGKVALSGQDADLAACQRIVAGTQTMTVYKPLKALARMAAGSAVTLARGEPVDSLVKVNNGLKDMPARLLEPIAVDKNNIDATVISDGVPEEGRGISEVGARMRAPTPHSPLRCIIDLIHFDGWSVGSLLVHRRAARRHADADRRPAHLRPLHHGLRSRLHPSRDFDQCLVRLLDLQP